MRGSQPQEQPALTETPPILEDPVSRLISFVRRGATGKDSGKLPRRRCIIGLAGYPGSGKSTICGQWADAVIGRCGANSITVLGMDGFHRTRAELQLMDNPEEALARRGAPYTFNPLLFIEKLKEVRNAGRETTVGWPGFEHEIGDPVIDAVQIAGDCPVILVEGIYVLFRRDEWAGLAGLFDETWFLDTPLETAMERLYKRHQAAWGLSEEKARFRADSNDRLNCENIRPGRPAADYLIPDGCLGR